MTPNEKKLMELEKEIARREGEDKVIQYLQHQADKRRLQDPYDPAGFILVQVVKELNLGAHKSLPEV